MKKPRKEAARWLAEFLKYYRQREKTIDLGELSAAERVGLMNGHKIERIEDEDDEDCK